MSQQTHSVGMVTGRIPDFTRSKGINTTQVAVVLIMLSDKHNLLSSASYIAQKSHRFPINLCRKTQIKSIVWVLFFSLLFRFFNVKILKILFFIETYKNKVTYSKARVEDVFYNLLYFAIFQTNNKNSDILEMNVHYRA